MANFGLTLEEYNELLDKMLVIVDHRANGNDNQAWALFDVLIAEEQLRTARKWQAVVDFNAMEKGVVF